ncbi:transglutaminase family protein [uncultured Aquimarina sp.]|uniref:transglutaminase-like domain-containing protein n=1 Tax=uncultured Aquimarina sp. TaxID=575652 RepID=UPI0026278189|nr:transglutaminase family protein [uncultured Aquimarina sp.]
METSPNNLADYKHPIVRSKALELTNNQTSIREKVAAIFHYVRDDIKFAFPKEGDFVKASKTIEYGYGQCNTKGTLFIALCKAIDIEARIHFSLIKKDIQKGLFSGIAFWLMPKYISHSWAEVKIDEKWVKIDSYINDKQFYEVGKKKLKEKNWDIGYSVACSKNESSINLDLDNEKFVQMDAVIGDHGVYDEPIVYYKSSKYKNRPNVLKNFFYRLWVGRINKKVEKLRYSCANN